MGKVLSGKLYVMGKALSGELSGTQTVLFRLRLLVKEDVGIAFLALAEVAASATVFIVQ